jgi:hypothetical protein
VRARPAPGRVVRVEDEGQAGQPWFAEARSPAAAQARAEDVLQAVPAPKRPSQHGKGLDRRPRRPECPHCGSSRQPILRSEISQSGWILFVVLLILCGPLCLLGLLMKEEYRVCADCGLRLGSPGLRFG